MKINLKQFVAEFTDTCKSLISKKGKLKGRSVSTDTHDNGTTNKLTKWEQAVKPEKTPDPTSKIKLAKHHDKVNGLVNKAEKSLEVIDEMLTGGQINEQPEVTNEESEKPEVMLVKDILNPTGDAPKLKDMENVANELYEAQQSRDTAEDEASAVVEKQIGSKKSEHTDKPGDKEPATKPKDKDVDFLVELGKQTGLFTEDEEEKK